MTRRNCMKKLGAGTAAALSQASVSASAAETAQRKLAIDRIGMDYGGRPMYLRAYHPPYVVYYYTAIRDGAVKSEGSLAKWKPLYDRVENEPDLMIRIVECYDDACAGCSNLTPDPSGSAWGVGYSCTTIKNAEAVRAVTLTCRRILGELGLYYGSEIKMRDIVPLLAENVPVLYEYIGGEANQKYYEKGLGYLREKYGLV